MRPPEPGPNGGLIDIVSGTELINGGWQKGVWTDNLAGMQVNGSFDIWDGNPVTLETVPAEATTK